MAGGKRGSWDCGSCIVSKVKWSEKNEIIVNQSKEAYKPASAQLPRHTIARRHLAVARSRTFEDTLDYDCFVEYLWHRELAVNNSMERQWRLTAVLIAYLSRGHLAAAIVHIEPKCVLAVVAATVVARRTFDELLFASAIVGDYSHSTLFVSDCWLIYFLLPPPPDSPDVAVIV